MFSLDFLLLFTYLKKPFLLSDTTVANVNSSWALAFLVFSLQRWAAALYSHCEARPFFQRSYIFFFHPKSFFSTGRVLCSARQVFCLVCFTCNTVGLPASGLLKGGFWKAITPHGPPNPLTTPQRLIFICINCTPIERRSPSIYELPITNLIWLMKRCPYQQIRTFETYLSLENNIIMLHFQQTAHTPLEHPRR